MTTTEPATALPTSSKVLCAIYAVISVVALIATWSQNAAYFDNPGGFLLDFFNDSKVTPASRSLSADIVLFFLAAGIMMVIEARKHEVKYVWAYIAGGFAIAISVTFPLFLLARELRLERSDATQLRNVDSVLLGVLAGVTLAFTLWVDVV